MPLDNVNTVTNIVPQNNLRLPDALTVKYGPASLLSRFTIAGDRFFREHGVRLRLRYDFDELVYINKQEIARGRWYNLLYIFSSEYSDLSPENAYWISGEDEHGEIALTQAGRVYHWPETSLADEARLMFYGGREMGQRCVVTADKAKEITGWVFNGGALWLRPDYRGKKFPSVIGRLGKAYSAARWPLDWATCYVNAKLFSRGGVAESYGYPHMTRSIHFPGSPIGELETVLLYMQPDEIYEDLTSFLDNDLLSFSSKAGGGAGGVSANRRGDTVNSTSSEVVRQGSTNRS
jgi:hypothetical protein